MIHMAHNSSLFAKRALYVMQVHCLVALTAGCSANPTVVSVPEYVTVPTELLQPYPCGREVVTNGDLLSAYAECVEAARRHEADKAAIAGLKPDKAR